MSKVTLTNIKAFIEGNFNFYLNKMGMFPQYKKEQVIYRMSKCQNDCIPEEACKECGCSPEKKMFTIKSCNKGERFPDIMEEAEWEQYKKDNNIEIYN